MTLLMRSILTVALAGTVLSGCGGDGGSGDSSGSVSGSSDAFIQQVISVSAQSAEDSDPDVTVGNVAATQPDDKDTVVVR